MIRNTGGEKDIARLTSRGRNVKESSPKENKNDEEPVVLCQQFPSPDFINRLTRSQANTKLKDPRKERKRGVRRQCCFAGCNITDQDKEYVNLNVIKKKPNGKYLPDVVTTGSIRTIKRKLQNHYLRFYTLDRCGQKDEGKDYYLCENHDKEILKVTKNIQREKNKTQSYTMELLVPKALGAKQAPKTESRGVGLQRLFSNNINAMNGEIDNLDVTNNNNTRIMQETIKENAQLAMQAYDAWEDENKNSQNIENVDDGKMNNQPQITLEDLTHEEVERRTGFKSRDMMLAFIILVCNGDHDVMTTTKTELTWLEEWLLFLEWEWGRTITWWVDAANSIQMSTHVAQQVVDYRMTQVLICRKSWPKYARHEEDCKMRKDKWNAKYDGVRIVMWDDTNVNFDFKPSGAYEQRVTYSSYYAGNCAKGGVFLQLGGWLGVEELWVGATSDTHYQEETGIFKNQEQFAIFDRVDGKLLAFTNIFDKGYRVNLAAWRAGKQRVIQPIFARSDRKFSGMETLVSGSVASDRSGNERAVNRAKKSNVLKRGLKAAGCPKRINNVWLSWSFQSNFMYRAVL